MDSSDAQHRYMDGSNQLITITESETKKYTQAWNLADYGGENSTGLDYVDMFFSIAKPQFGARVIDIGSGDGSVSLALKKRGLQVHSFDLVEQEPINGIPFHQGCIWHGLPRGPYDFGFCTDVMEHIPTQFVGLAIDRVLASTPRAFFSVCFKKDVHGDAMRDRLHLTIESFNWWRDTFREVSTVYEARDLIGDGVFYVGR